MDIDLSPDQKSTLKQASRSAIREVIPDLEGYWLQKSWLSDSNPYSQDIITQLNENQISDHAQLAEYVAASAIIHCFDGWSYLGRALEAEMAGDPDAARHLGYYAELRAAMSVLAGNGIGVFKRKHIIVIAPQKCLLIPPKPAQATHYFAWEALKAWANSPAGHDILFQVIRPGGIPLQEWLNHFRVGSDFIASKWLEQWGLDLSQLTMDRDARDLASYRPTTFTSPGPRPIVDTMETIQQFWEICEPEAVGGFPVLDRHLLRRSLALVNEGTDRDDPQARNLYESQINTMLDALDPKELLPDQWAKFLKYENLQDIPSIIQDAEEKKDSSHLDHSKQVLARATLLLRVATGSSADLLSEAGPTVKEDLAFWWSSAAVRRRLWSEDDEPASFIDLWQDVDEVIDAVDQWPQDYYTLWSNHAREAAILATTERAFLWGLEL